MTSQKKAPTKSASKNKQPPNHQPNHKKPPPPLVLSEARRAEIEAEANALGEKILLFPGKLARRAAWSSKIVLAAERDAADLVRAPFPEPEPQLTHAEITAHGERIIFLRICQSQWRAVQLGQKQAHIDFDEAGAEASAHKNTLLRFFAFRYKYNAEGQKWLTDVRAGSGDADLVQDISDILERCGREEAAIAVAPRGEAEAAARLAVLLPELSRLLSVKALGDEALRARKLRDAAYTLVIKTERRIRDAAEYWYGGTEKTKDYAAFPASAGGSYASEDSEDAVDTEQAAEPGDQPIEAGAAEAIEPPAAAKAPAPLNGAAVL